MKLSPYLYAAAIFIASSGIASADTITLNSVGQVNSNSGYTAPAINSSTNSVAAIAGGTTYDIPTGGGVWAGPLGASSWVSQNPQNFPGGSNVEPNGTYTYSSSFTTTGAVTGGSLEVLADDTTSVYLNGNLLVAAASADPASHCTAGSPNCETLDTINLANYLADFNTGINTLTFGVEQDFGSAEGLDFSGSLSTVAPTPELNSLLLLGTGLVAAAGFVNSRRLHA
jgi:hypothetical protein